ncbi:MAG: hypothetical protein FHP92_14710 [Denitromonas halophila]|nr:MAG: hypothetical protein FHP92_14710 [Denitromonas halophila]
MFFRKLRAANPRSERREKFQAVMHMAAEMNKCNPRGLQQLIFALLRPLQAEQMLAVAENVQHGAPAGIESSSFFFQTSGIVSETEQWMKPNPNIKLDLKQDIILPTPWVRARFASALSHIGQGRAMGAWKEDTNHVIALWLPWRIGFVNGGNHSITAGILRGEGTVTARDVFDMSPLLERVTCDGDRYFDTVKNRVVGEVQDHRRAAVFEIGRLIMQQRATPSVLQLVPR